MKELGSRISAGRDSNRMLPFQQHVRAVDCHGHLIQHYTTAWVSGCEFYQSLLLCLFYPVDCGKPEFPSGGSVDEVTSTTEGAIVSFQCEAGFILPSDLNSTTINCTNVNDIGKWLPNPAEQECRPEGPEGMHHFLCQVKPLQHKVLAINIEFYDL